MPASEPRFCIAQVTDQARSGWRDYCDREGVNRSALAEVIGIALGHGQSVPEEWLAAAQRLQNERRARS